MIESLDVDHLIVVEPHADDAFLSMGQHIEERTKANKLTTILTIFSGTRKRARDAEDYAKAVGAIWLGVGLVEAQPLDEDRIMAQVFASVAPVTPVPLDNGSLFVVPLGLTHPEHIAVRDLFLRRTSDCCAFYLDQPYAITQRNGALTTELLRGKRVLSYRHPGVRKYRHIPLFKDQAKFYHYNPADKLVQTSELIVA